MAKEDFLKARLRKYYDRDIRNEIKRRKDANMLSDGELSDIIREGVRRVLFGQDPKPKKIDSIFSELKEKDPSISFENAEALVDDLLNNF